MNAGARWLACVVVPAVVAGGCAGKAKWDETREVYVVSLPNGAEVIFEGQPAGTTPVSVPLPPAGAHPGPLEVRLERPGFRPEVRHVPAAAPPDRLVVVLLPDVPDATAPPLDDAEGFYRIGRALVEARRCRDAIEFLDRTLELAPRHARAHRDRGGCLLDLGEAALAIDSLSRYLLLAPDAPDAGEIQAQIDGLRGPRTIDLDVAGGE